MTASLATGLRMELEEIMDSKIKTMLSEFETCLAKATSAGQILTKKPDQDPPMPAGQIFTKEPDQDPPMLSPLSIAKDAQGRYRSFVSNSQQNLTDKLQSNTSAGPKMSPLSSSGRCQPLDDTGYVAELEVMDRLSARNPMGSAREIAFAPGEDVAYQALSAQDADLMQATEEDELDPRDQLFMLNCVTVVMLLLNAVVDVFEVRDVVHKSDLLGSNVGADNLSTWYTLLTFCFNMAFLVELGFRVRVLGVHFINKRNFFHMALTVTQIIEMIALLRQWCFGQPLSELMTPLCFRMVNIIRTVRVFNVLDQLDYTNELHLLLASMSGSLRSLSWSALFIIVPMYVFAMALTQLVEDFRMKSDSDFNDEAHAQLMRYFGTIDRSMLTLFWAIAGGLSWSEATLTLGSYGFDLTAQAFVLYVASMSFATLNVLTGVFVNSANVAASSEKNRKMLGALRKIFVDVDNDKSGTLTHTEFMALLKHKDIDVCLQSLNIPPSQANHLFQLIDSDSSGVVDIDEFILGCDMLQGSLKAIDFATFLHDFQVFKAEVLHFLTHIGEGNIPDAEAVSKSRMSKHFKHEKSELLSMV